VGLRTIPVRASDLGGCFRDSRWRPLLKRGLDRRAVTVQSASGPTQRDGFERLQAPGHVGLEGTMEACFRDATPSQDVAMGAI
jgi:hypothetical protein